MRPVRFEVLGPLRAGEGSRAQLGLAVMEDGRAEPCVLVLVPDEVENDPALLRKIANETRHASQLDHQNIVTVFGFTSLQEGHARCVEFADGESVRRILNLSDKIPPRIAAKLVCDACVGVHYAHLAGNDDGLPLVHGDLRPETLLVSFAGVVKVTGYGALAFAPKEIGGQRVKGRRAHSAPEQIIGGRDAVTVATDVYLLGLTLYELLTGTVPWVDQAEGFDQAVLTYPLPPATPGLIPEDLMPVLEKACLKKAPQRYPTPLALKDAIERALGAEVATQAELVVYLETLFPESGEVRTERRRTIDAGIADFARQQWRRPSTTFGTNPSEPTPTERTSAPGAVQSHPTPAPVHVAPPAPPAPPTVTASAKASGSSRPAPIPVSTQHSDDSPADDEPEPRDRKMWWVAGAFVAVVSASVYFASTFANAPVKPKGEPEVPVSVVATLDAGARDVTPPQIDAGPTNPAQPADSGTDTVVDAGSGGPNAVTELVVTIESRPSLDLTIDGNSVGRTPWSGRLNLGQHKLKLESKELLINQGRTLTVEGREPMAQSYTFSKGQVDVTAPEGANIFIDGRKMGTAPLAHSLSIYEGFHRITVKVGQAQWTETFTLYEDQRVRFNVELEPQ